MKAIVQYQVGDFSGVIEVYYNEKDTDEYIIAKARQIVLQRAYGPLLFGYESWKIVSKEY